MTLIPITRQKPKRVNPIGPRNAKIVLVGEAPGKEENETGIPFTGSSGHLLTQLLKQAGIDRAECYITNVVKFRPPDNKLSRLEEIGCSLSESMKELRERL